MVESLKKEEKKSRENFDQLNFEGDPDILKQMVDSKAAFQLSIGKNEVLLWSGKVSKYNKYNWV